MVTHFNLEVAFNKGLDTVKKKFAFIVLDVKDGEVCAANQHSSLLVVFHPKLTYHFVSVNSPFFISLWARKRSLQVLAGFSLDPMGRFR